MPKLLGSPCKIGSLEIKNRTVFESMGNSLAELDGSAGPEAIAFYEARARGGVGLIMSEACSVDSKTGRANPRNMCIDSDDHIPSYKKLMEKLHEYDCKFFLELYHPGRQGVSDFNGGMKMYAPSAIECQCVHQPVQEMTLDQIKETIDKYIEGAVRAKAAGIDGVLIHGAHGYLITQFLSPHTNKRDDEYGGSLEKRAKFALDIIKGIREKCGQDYPVGIRFSACEYLDYNGLSMEEGITPEMGIEYAKMFESAGVDLIDVSSGIYETMNTAWEPTSFDQGWKRDLAKNIKKAVKVPVVGCCVIRDPDFAEELLEKGELDFVGSARAHLADPEWPNKAIAGQSDDIRKCISCLNCMKTLMMGEHMSCAVNAEGCYETERGELKKDGQGRTVVVIGAGPSGMEAARVLSLRGFEVTLFEKEKAVGGDLLRATVPPCKGKLKWFIDYLEGQLKKQGVKIRLGESPTPEDVKAMDPYAVFIASGANPIVPGSIPGINGSMVHTYKEVLDGDVTLTGKRIVLVGAGMTGLETAEYLVSKGNDVSVYDLLPEVAQGEHFQNIIDVETRLSKVPQYTGHKLMEITDHCAVFDAEGKKVEADCDAVVLSMGMRPNTAYSDGFKELSNVFVVGTNVTYSGVGPAVANAYMAAVGLD